eukprot:COSAG02_NODE_4109_length_5767_cov_9.135321_3_plen_72_part_00
MDGDGLVNVNDLLSMLSQFGAEGARPEDVNGDNIVNVRSPSASHTFHGLRFVVTAPRPSLTEGWAMLRGPA